MRGRHWFLLALALVLAGQACLMVSSYLERRIPTDVPVFQADLDHDGKAEKIAIVLPQEGVSDDGVVSLQVFNQWGKLLYKEDLGLSHDEYSVLCLYRANDEREYLLRYRPVMYQGGICSYSYSVFDLDEQGVAVLEREGSISFDINFQTLGDSLPLNLNPQKLAAFINEVNGLLEKSILLVSSEGGRLAYSLKPEQALGVQETLAWLDRHEEEYGPGDSLEARLEKYKEKEEEFFLLQKGTEHEIH